MRLAVTVGFDADLVIRALAGVTARDLILIRGVTGYEGDEKSKDTVAKILKALGRGAEFAVDLRNLPNAIRQLYDLSFDAVALAGGPRVLVVLTFVVAVLRGSKIFLVPEYSGEVIDISGFSSISTLRSLTKPKLKILALLNVERNVEELAKELGLDTTTVYRHLQVLEDAGLVKKTGKRGGRYNTDQLTAVIASLILNTG
ncbi:CRISPR-associated CARF protein Csa3 [Pyrobaculum aerophilum]|uniref:CRISPR-associated CARF protein Csa3 n=1 Tax=Pyrobaculum aerophilum TaxID=13773 RepID=UPI0023EF9D03|nr:CRISPR-associated CARF protein Csa3 [Pyrobaculum aerophilum]MCX8136989.1 CRISPR-associated CARF protein Csa3 [Pyrobaculum aerophilum]